MYSVCVTKYFFHDSFHPLVARLVTLEPLDQLPKKDSVFLGKFFRFMILFADFQIIFIGYIKLSFRIELLILGISLGVFLAEGVMVGSEHVLEDCNKGYISVFELIRFMKHRKHELDLNDQKCLDIILPTVNMLLDIY